MKPYPKEYATRQSGSSLATATARGIREFKKIERLGSLKTLTIKVSKI